MEYLTQTFKWPEVDASRFASLITTDGPEHADVVLVGLPDDLGVRLNGGRPGAKDGPRVFRETLAKMGTRYDLNTGEELGVRIHDAGDVAPAEGEGEDAIEETHRRVTESARAFHDDGKVVVGIGGGHDLTFPMVRALSESLGKTIGGVNVDPHLDVRESVGSGMPYRRLIEGGFVDASRFIEYGTGRFDNSREHVEWLRGKGGTIQGITGVRAGAFIPLRAVEQTCEGGEAFVSIDMDCVEGAFGVSAVPSVGVSLDHVLGFARRAGEHEEVHHFDIMELSPGHDVGNRTARIAVTLFQTFVAGVQVRMDT